MENRQQWIKMVENVFVEKYTPRKPHSLPQTKVFRSPFRGYKPGALLVHLTNKNHKLEHILCIKTWQYSTRNASDSERRGISTFWN